MKYYLLELIIQRFIKYSVFFEVLPEPSAFILLPDPSPSILLVPDPSPSVLELVIIYEHFALDDLGVPPVPSPFTAKAKLVIKVKKKVLLVL